MFNIDNDNYFTNVATEIVNTCNIENITELVIKCLLPTIENKSFVWDKNSPYNIGIENILFPDGDYIKKSLLAKTAIEISEYLSTDIDCSYQTRIENVKYILKQNLSYLINITNVYSHFHEESF